MLYKEYKKNFHLKIFHNGWNRNDKDINIECDTQACLKLQDSQSIVLIVVLPIQRYFGHNQIIIYLTAM